MKALTPESTRAIAEAVVPLHISHYDRGALNTPMWNIVLDFASYAGFDVSLKLADINSHIKDEWMKISIHSLKESREAAKDMDDFAGGDAWITDFEDKLKAVMAI